jgi:hypothetical protein
MSKCQDPASGTEIQLPRNPLGRDLAAAAKKLGAGRFSLAKRKSKVKKRIKCDSAV